MCFPSRYAFWQSGKLLREAALRDPAVRLLAYRYELELAGRSTRARVEAEDWPRLLFEHGIEQDDPALLARHGLTLFV
jgi:hypothetical protein